MNGITVQAEAHEDGLGFELFFKQGHDRDAASRPLRYGRNAKSFRIGFVGCLVTYVVDRGDIGMTAVMRGYFDTDPFWGNAFEVGGERAR